MIEINVYFVFYIRNVGTIVLSRFNLVGQYVFSRIFEMNRSFLIITYCLLVLFPVL